MHRNAVGRLIHGFVTTLVLVAGGCSSSSNEGADCTPQTIGTCRCPGTDFQYDGSCNADGKLECGPCPSAQPRSASCGVSKCNSSIGSPIGSWTLADACPFEIDQFLQRCTGVSLVENLQVVGTLVIDDTSYAQGSLSGKATLTSDQTPDCGSSCAAIRDVLSQNPDSNGSLECQTGQNGIACECDITKTFLSASGARVYSDAIALTGANLQPDPFKYCVNGDMMTLSNSYATLAFVRATAPSP